MMEFGRTLQFSEVIILMTESKLVKKSILEIVSSVHKWFFLMS